MALDIYRQYFEVLTIPVIVLDTNGKVLEINQAYINQFCFGAVDQGEVVGKHIYALPFASQIGIAKIYGAMQNSSESEKHIATIPVDGDTNEPSFEITSNPLFNDGERFATIFTHHDISEITKLKKALKDQEILLDEIQEVSGLGSWDLHLPSGKAIWSKEEYRLLGYDPEKDDATAENFIARIHKDDRERILNELQKPFTDKSVYKAEFRLVMPDGKVRYVAERGQVIFNEEGMAVRFLGTTLDISERIEVEKRLILSENELRKILENMQDTYYRTDTEGRVVRVSPSVESLLGYKPEEVIGTKIIDLYVHPEERQRLYKELQDTNGKVQDFEAPLKCKDGSVIWVSTNAHYYLQDGVVAGIEGTTRNITQLKKAQDELQRHRNELEVLVDERTRELEAFSYSVSHDLRAPLRTINGFGLAIEEEYSELLDEKGKDYLRRVRTSTQRMSDLIDDLLQLARISRQNISEEIVDISGIAKNIMCELSQEEPERIVTTVIASGLMVKGDSRLLEIAMRNLLKNAWKFTSKREEALIEFGATNYPGTNKTVYFVRDNGVGFDIKYMEKLFLPFQRLHKLDDFSGTGIGLAIVKRVLERHDGEVWAESVQDQGATFYFTLSGK